MFNNLCDTAIVSFLLSIIYLCPLVCAYISWVGNIQQSRELILNQNSDSTVDSIDDCEKSIALLSAKSSIIPNSPTPEKVSYSLRYDKQVCFGFFSCGASAGVLSAL